MRKLIVGAWRQAGLAGRAGRWRSSGPEVAWLLQIEGDWLGRIGVVMDASVRSPGEAPSPDDYPLRMFAEHLRSIDGLEFAHALNPEIQMDDAVRAIALSEGARGVAEFVIDHGTFDSLRSSYLAGVLDSHSIRKDLRERLEASRL
jgi:hypothetical protein